MEGHHPERVFRQFGMKQPLPQFVDTSSHLHKISFQSKWDEDWAVEHAVHIQQWGKRGQLVQATPFLDGDTTYLVEYIRWYNASTRQYITLESAYWEMMVRQQFLPLLQFCNMCELQHAKLQHNYCH